MDAIIIILLIVLTIIFMRKFSNVVYVICILDMFLRILHKIKDMLGITEFTNLINKYFHSSIENIIGSYSSGIIYTILVWLLIVIYVVFLYYVICTFFRKKK